MSKPTAVIVLCEDNRTFSFTRSYLKRCGINRGIRPVISPRGSAFTFVLNNFPEQVNAYRLAKARKDAWLIAVVDADTCTIAQRIGEMDRKLTQAQEPRVRTIRIEDEKIARLVPRRNIETWIEALNSSPVNETVNYKETIRRTNEEWYAFIPAAAATFFAFTRPNTNLPENLIDSLRHGIGEMQRAFQAAR
jgi:hypothetical protein